MTYPNTQTYDTTLDTYCEPAALQDLLQTVHIELEKSSERLESSATLDVPSFSISIGGKSIAFYLGAPQAEALFDFIRHIAGENLYDVDIDRGYVSDVDRQHDYLVDCLKSAVAYCKSQFEESNIDWLPTVNFVDNTMQEADKFNMLQQFVNSLN